MLGNPSLNFSINHVQVYIKFRTLCTCMHTLSVTLVQSPLYWENPVANVAMFEEKIWQLSGQTDVIVLPEMFTTGFSMNAPALAEPMHLTTFRWMKNLASQTGAVLTGSFIVKEGGQFYNRLLWMQPDGTYYFYDKNHLFSPAGENQVYAAGTQRLVVTWKGWKICPLVCYDLRFPEWSRNHWHATPEGLTAEYDCLLYVASWPQPRHLAWQTLLRARAIENLSYCLGVNRIGTDANGHAYPGGSAAVDFQGNTIFEAGSAEMTQTVVLDKIALEHFRQEHPFYVDA